MMPGRVGATGPAPVPSPSSPTSLTRASASAVWVATRSTHRVPVAPAGSRGPCPRSARTGRRGSARRCAGRRSGRSGVSGRRGSRASGTVTRRRAVGPRAVAAIAMNWRATPAGSKERSKASPASRAVRVLVDVRGAAPDAQPVEVVARCSGRDRSVAGGPISEPSASGAAWPTSGSPVVDITEVIESRRSGCSMARVCTIMPPIDRPITWARVDPERVEHRDRVGGHVGERVGDLRRFAVTGRHHARHVGSDVGEVGRQADVAVVEADRRGSLGGEALAPLGPVVDALAAESVDQEQRRIGRVAERLVVELH